MKGSFIRKAVPARMGLDGLPVWERGAEKREQPGGVESISSAGVVELRIHVSVSAMMSGLWLSVRSLSAVTCAGVSMERALRVQIRRFTRWLGPGLGWISPQRGTVAVSKER